MVSPTPSFYTLDAGCPAGCLESHFGTGIEAAPSLGPAIVVGEAYSDLNLHRTANWDPGHVAHCSPFAMQMPEKDPYRLESPLEQVGGHYPWIDQMLATP